MKSRTLKRILGLLVTFALVTSMMGASEINARDVSLEESSQLAEQFAEIGVSMRSSDLKNLIYEEIVEEYLLMTGIERSQADAIFSEIKSVELDDFVFEKILYGEEKNLDYEENLFFAQKHYSSLISYISQDTKEIVDKYYLYYVIQFYLDYSEPSEFGYNLVSDDIQIMEATPAKNSQDIFIMDTEDFEKFFVDPNEVILQPDIIGSNSNFAPIQTTSSNTTVATVRIFVGYGNDGSSGGIGWTDYGHAWLTVTNNSTSNITVGGLSNIAPGKTVSIGTWGNVNPHKGVWYNLEARRIALNNRYTTRSSISISVSQANLNSLNTSILNNDAWSYTNNCASFAVRAWNAMSATTNLSAGTPNTPDGVYASMLSKGSPSQGISVPYHYDVYYRASSPVRASAHL
jgi:hypothetical protein